MKNAKLLLKGLSKFVDERNIVKARLIFDEFHPSDIYKEIKDWPTEKAVLLLRLLKEDDASELFSEFNPEQQEEIIEALTSEEITELFEEMYTDEAIDILEDLPDKIVNRVLMNAKQETKSKINSILRFEKNQTGYHMVLEFVAIPLGLTIKEAKKQIADQINNEDLEIVGNIYVYDSNTDEYIGFLRPDAIIANDNKSIIDEYVEKIKAINSTSHIGEAQEAIGQYDISAIPVVNSKNRLIGVIEADDIIELHEEAEEAAYEQSAIKIIDKPYLEIKSWEMFKSRIPWIIALLIIGTLTQMIIIGFQSIWINAGVFTANDSMEAITITNIATLSIATALSLSSSINDAAGNAGSQTSSTLVRAIALGEITKGTYMKALKKEFIVSNLIGISVMVTAFIRIILVWGIFGFYKNIDSNAIGWLFLIATIASVSFFITIIIGNLVGAILPIIADRYGIDGAIFSGPVQTTVVDIITILIYFTLTTIVFVVIPSPVSNYHIDTRAITHTINNAIMLL